MAQKQKPSMVGYYAAMEWLFENRPHMMEYIAALGAPKNDRRCSRAMVVAGPNYAPRLYTNDEWLQEIGPAYAAGVLVHEWRHVLLGHHAEGLNPKPQWRYPKVLTDTHEVVINDSLELTGYHITDDAVKGEIRGGHFYGYWTTDEAYGPMEEWYLSQKPQDTDDSKDDGSEDSSEDSSGEDSGSGSGSGGGSGSADDPAPSDSESADSNGDPEQHSDGNSEDSNSSSGSSSGSSEAGAGEADTEEGSSSRDGASNSEDATGEADGSGAKGDAESNLPEDATIEGCDHGTYIEGEDGELREMDEHELGRFIDKLNDLISEAIQSTPMPEDEKPSENELDAMDQAVAEAIDPSRSGSYSKRAGLLPGAVEQVLAGGKLHLGWLKLLQKINPDVGKADGGLNAKASYNWARPRRSTSLVRGAMLPSTGEPRGRGVGTKMKPVALIALDFSDSIDKRLSNAMKDMAQSIPEEHIEARCFTFSTVAVPFDFRSEHNRVASGGTDFSCIEQEALKIQKETGEYPYVICLTDGQAWFEGQGYRGYSSYGARGSAAIPTQPQLDSRWLWVDVLTEDDGRAFHNGIAYAQVKAQKNLSGLPYDRSKL